MKQTVKGGNRAVTAVIVAVAVHAVVAVEQVIKGERMDKTTVMMTSSSSD